MPYVSIEARRASQRRWRERHPERVAAIESARAPAKREYLASYYQRNREALIAASRARYAEKRVELLAHQSERGQRPDVQEARAGARRLRQFGISPTAFASMLLAQAGSCAICRMEETRRRRNGTTVPLHVDHDHRTGLVRGLLCSKCNKAIGLLRDDPTILRAAISYLEAHNERVERRAS